MTIFLYILRDFFKYVLGIVALCLFLFILGDFIHKTTRYFQVHQPSTDHMIQFYIYQMPSQLIQILPISGLLASVISMILMSRTNEITAMRAAGMGPLQVGMPIVAGGLILSFAAFFLGEIVVPRSAARMHYVKEVLIERSNKGEAAGGTRWFRDQNRLVTFSEYDYLSQTIFAPKIIETGTNNRPTNILHASSAHYEPRLGVWEMHDVRRIEFNPLGTIQAVTKLEDQLIEIPIEPEKLQRERRKPNELSLLELRDIVSRGRQSGADVTSIDVERHLKFAFYFASVVVCLMGIKFAYQSERTVESAKNVLIAMLLGIMYWVIYTAGAAVGKHGALPPWLAAWAANVLVGASGILEIYRARRA